MDKESAVTLLSMLSHPDDYEGGELQHVESSGRVRSARLQRGDAALYRSNQRHQVTPTTQGTRITLAVEFWHVSPAWMARHIGPSCATCAGPGDGRPELGGGPIAPYFGVCPR